MLGNRTLDFLSDLREPDEDVVLVQDVGNQTALPRRGELRPPLDVLLLLLRHSGEDRIQVGVVLACLRHPGVYLARRAVELDAEPEYLAHTPSLSCLHPLSLVYSPKPQMIVVPAGLEKWSPRVT